MRWREQTDVKICVQVVIDKAVSMMFYPLSSIHTHCTPYVRDHNIFSFFFVKKICHIFSCVVQEM
jgi:hypothetical protein